MLAADCDVETNVDLAKRLGTPPFDTMTEKEGVSELRRLWKLHADAATEYCVKRCGAGTRPELFWDDKKRPFVTPRDWNSSGDGARFAAERRAADLAYLREHKHLSKEELASLDEKEKQYGPDAEE